MPENFLASKSLGRITIYLQAVPMGDDLLVALHGGDKSHIGAVAVSQPHSALSPEQPCRATTSVIALPEHREDSLARQLAQQVAKDSGVVAVVACGIHLDGITAQEINQVIQLSEELARELINWKNRGSL